MIYKIKIPLNTQVKISSNAIKITGPFGTIIKKKSKNLNVYKKQNILYILDNLKDNLTLNLVNILKSLLIGVSKGYSKKLKIIGVEFKVNVKDNKLILRLGFSHEIIYTIPHNIQIYNPKSNILVITGYSNQIVSQIAAEIRNLKLPEPYKGKGILYFNEKYQQKEGKKT